MPRPTVKGCRCFIEPAGPRSDLFRLCIEADPPKGLQAVSKAVVVWHGDDPEDLAEWAKNNGAIAVDLSRLGVR